MQHRKMQRIIRRSLQREEDNSRQVLQYSKVENVFNREQNRKRQGIKAQKEVGFQSKEEIQFNIKKKLQFYKKRRVTVRRKEEKRIEEINNQ